VQGVAANWIAPRAAIDDALMRARIVLLVASLAAPAAAQADVTVIYAAPASPAPLAAVPVCPGSATVAVAPAVAVTRTGSATGSVTVSDSVSDSVTVSDSATVSDSGSGSASVTDSASVSATGSGSDATSGPCVAPPGVRFIRTTDGSREARLLALTDCHGAPDPESLLELSILARPRTADRPDARDLAAHADDPELFASEVRRLDPGLLVRLRRIGDRFPGHDIEITSGYRPDARESSRHRTGHALDLRVLGAPLEEVHAFALGFDESGVGLYPTSEFLHVDVRPRVTRWVDLAGPGEPTNMVEVVTARDGHAHSAPALRWPEAPADSAASAAIATSAPVEGLAPRPAAEAAVAPRPASERRRRARRPAAEEDHRAALREALDALDALEGLDLGVPGT
jgi:hypothetical protein